MIAEGLRRQTERDRIQREALSPEVDDLRPSNGARIPDLPREDPCFVIREIAVLGADAQRFHWLQAATDPFLSRCIGTQGATRIVAYLDALLIEQGYVTSRIGIGPQSLAQGRLELRLQTGRIAKIRMVDAGTPGKPVDSGWGTWVNAFPTREGRLLDAQDLEQGVEQMKRLPSQTVVTTLAPGDAPDTSVVTIERQTGSPGKRLRGGVTLDNSGSAALGRSQVFANLALDNPLGLNDIASLSGNSNAESPSAGHRSQSVSFDYSVPFGYALFSANVASSRFAQQVQLTTSTTLSSGRSNTASIKWQEVVYRSASAKTGVYATLSTRRASSYLDDVELVAQHRETTFFEGGIEFKRLFAGNVSLELQAGYKRGVPWLSAEDDLQPDPFDASAVPTLRPHLWLLNVSFALPILQPEQAAWPARDWQFSSNLRAQYTHDHTLSIDQFGIGGRYTVRGFDGDAVLLAESGWTLRNELSTPLKLPGVDSQFYAALDAGRTWGASDANLVGNFLAGTAVGLRGKFSAWPALQFDLALATPLIRPERFKTARLSFYGNATYAF